MGVRRPHCGIERQHPFELRHRRPAIAGFLEREAEVEPRLRMVGIGPQETPIGRDRRFGAPGRLEGPAEQELRIPVVRIDAGQALDIDQRGRRIAADLQGPGGLVLIGEIPAIDIGGAAEFRPRLPLARGRLRDSRRRRWTPPVRRRPLMPVSVRWRRTIRRGRA